MAWLRVRDRGSYVRMTAVLFLVFAASGLTVPLLSNYVTTLGAEKSQIGLVFAVYQIASLASQYWWGRHSDRLGRRKPLLLIGTAGLALAYLLTASASRYEFLFAIRVLEGLSFAAYGTGSLALIGDLLENQEQRGRFMGAYRMFGSLAFAISALAGGWVADTFGQRVPIAASAVFFGLACALVTSIRENQGARPAPPAAQPETQGPAPQPAEQTVDWRILGPFLGLTGAWSIGMGSVITLWPIFMADQGYTQTQISGLWALAAAGEVIWLFVAGLLADRIGRKWVIITGVVGMACIYLLYLLARGFVWFIPIQIMRSFTYSCFETPALLYATELGLRKQRGRLAGLYNSAAGLGGITGSAAGGWIAQVFGMAATFSSAALLMIVMGFVAALVMPRRKSAQAAVSAPAVEAR